MYVISMTSCIKGNVERAAATFFSAQSMAMSASPQSSKGGGGGGSSGGGGGAGGGGGGSVSSSPGKTHQKSIKSFFQRGSSINGRRASDAARTLNNGDGGRKRQKIANTSKDDESKAKESPLASMKGSGTPHVASSKDIMGRNTDRSVGGSGSGSGAISGDGSGTVPYSLLANAFAAIIKTKKKTEHLQVLSTAFYDILYVMWRHMQAVNILTPLSS